MNRQRWYGTAWVSPEAIRDGRALEMLLMAAPEDATEAELTTIHVRHDQKGYSDYVLFRVVGTAFVKEGAPC